MQPRTGLRLRHQVACRESADRARRCRVAAHRPCPAPGSVSAGRCTDIHGPAAERDIERVSAEQVDHGHEDEQESGLPALLRCRCRCGLPNTTISTTASGTSEAMPSTTPTNRLAADGKREGNREQLEGQIDRGEPRHVEAQPVRGEQAERAFHALERAGEPEEVDLPRREPQREQNARPGNG